MRLGRALLLCVLIGAAAAAAAWIYIMSYRPDAERYPVRGIDVSRHQGEIDWSRVAGDEVAFAYIKATEGGDWRDPSFAANWRGATAAGLATGAYHFFTLCRPGIEQAENFLSVLPKHGPMLPPAIDLEYVGNCAERPSREAFGRELDSFLARVEGALGRKVIFYSPEDFLAAYRSAIPDRPLWRRSLWRPPVSDDWLIWQYQFLGRVDGIAGDVDLNVLRGDAPSLADLQTVPAASSP